MTPSDSPEARVREILQQTIAASDYFAGAGTSSFGDDGLVLTMPDRSEFHITVTCSHRPQRVGLGQAWVPVHPADPADPARDARYAALPAMTAYPAGAVSSTIHGGAGPASHLDRDHHTCTRGPVCEQNVPCPCEHESCHATAGLTQEYCPGCEAS